MNTQRRSPPVIDRNEESPLVRLKWVFSDESTTLLSLDSKNNKSASKILAKSPAVTSRRAGSDSDPLTETLR